MVVGVELMMYLREQQYLRAFYSQCLDLRPTKIDTDAHLRIYHESFTCTVKTPRATQKKFVSN